MNPDLDQFNSKQDFYTGCIAFSDGQCIWGKGFGSEGTQVAEICFNTSMTGYQEILTDLSYSGQIINFTFPHIGNTGTNIYDNESDTVVALGMISRNIPTQESNWQADKSFNSWLKKNNVIGIGNVDTRKITRLIRSDGVQSVAISHSKSGFINSDELKKLAKSAAGLKGKELTADVTCAERVLWKKRNRSNQTVVQSNQYSHRPTLFATRPNIPAVSSAARRKTQAPRRRSRSHSSY